MVAIDVAMAILMAMPAGTPLFDRMKVRKGTCIMPPPTPSMPARKPVQMPSAASSAASHGSTGIKRASSRPTARHSCGVTGVIDRRLPVASTRIVASSGAARISRSGSSRVLRVSVTSSCTQRGLSGLDLGSK